MRYRLRHDRLRRELARRRISQNRWAQILGLSKSHLSMLLNGQRPYPEASTRRKLQEGLGVRLDELFELEHDANPQPEYNLMESLLQDLRHAWRALRARPLFVSVIVLTLAVGIGPTTALYSVIDATILRPLPFEDPERLVRLFGVSPTYGVTRGQLSMANTVDWRERTQAFESITLYRARTFNVSGTGEPERTLSLMIADQYLEMLGLAPALGRTFSPEEHLPNGPAVALISDAMWERRFQREPTVLGRTLRIDTTDHVIVGVLPPRFADSRLTVDLEEAPELVLPLAVEAGTNRGAYWLHGIARLAPGVTLADARAEADEFATWLRTEYPDEVTGHHLRPVPLADVVAGDLRAKLMLFLGAVAAVLLVGCINVANLMLAYATSRRREVAIRKALGAGKLRLIRLTLVESLLLSILGGTAGVAVAAGLLRVARPVLPAYVLRHDLVGIDPRLLFAALALSIGTAMVFGILPAIGIARTSARDELIAGVVGHSGRGRMRLLRGLAVTQIAMAGILAIGSGLVVRSYAELVSVDPGFEASGLLTFYTIPRYSFETRAEQHEFVAALHERLETLPGVTSVGEINFLPFSDNEGGQGIEIDGREPVEGITDIAQFRAASHGFFGVLDVDMIAGRDFLPSDMPDGDVVIIDRAMADRFWPGGDALGQRFRAGGDTFYRVIGVAPDLKWHGYDDSADPHFFVPYGEDGWSSTRGFLLRVDGEPTALSGAVRAAVRDVNPNQSIYAIESMEQRMAATAAGSRFSLRLLVALCATAVLLAIVGTYGMFAYSVSERTSEIGIRLALGAATREVQRAVLAQSLAIAGAGIVLAIVGSRMLTGTVSSLLFAVSPDDPMIVIGASLVIVSAALAAAWIPARRAARIDPARALRE